MEFPPSDRWDEINELLVEAAARPPGEERSAFLEECGADDAVRRAVKDLLAADATYGDLFERGAAAVARPLVSPESGEAEPTVRLDPGRQVESYRILERIGEGGTSTVYRAERTDDQFQRTVAIKVLRGVVGADDQAAERFRAERQILASFSHPHLAEVYDGGVLPDGRPYLVMEYVDGRSLTRHCREEHCSLSERLALARQAASAVQAVHKQLVVHRDLKPSNVLVERQSGQVKLLDFGIAKILGELPGTAPPSTRTGRHPMTPAYAAPEQVKGAPIRVATDVYALGVLLYEVLSGTRPFGGDGASPYAVARAVCEEEPSPPSAAAGGTVGVPFSAIDADLDAIVLMALRKEPGARYDTVDALLDDLDRYQDDRPVRAQRGGWAYRTRKFLRRHQAGLIGTLIAVLLLAALGTYHVRRLTAERNRAQKEAQTAEQVSQYLTSLFEEADPHLARGDTVTARELLRQGMHRIDELEGQPLVQAELMYVLGRTRRRIGLYDSTRALFEQALEIRRQHLGREDPKVAQVLSKLAILVRDAEGDYAEAESLLTEATAIYRAVHGSRHESVAARLKELVFVQRQQGKLEEAKESVRQALSIQRAIHGEEHMSVAESLYNLAAILRDQERYEEAEAVQRRSLALCRKLTDGPHPGTAANLHNLGYVLSEQSKYREAETLYRRALSMKRELFDAPHPEIATTLENLSQVHHKQDEYENAEADLRKTLRMRRALHENGHPFLAGSLVNLGDLLQDQRQLAAADSAFRAARSMLRRLGQEESPKMADALRQHGALLQDRRALAEAKTAYKKALTLERKTHDSDHSDVRELESTLASLPGE